MTSVSKIRYYQHRYLPDTILDRDTILTGPSITYTITYTEVRSCLKKRRLCEESRNVSQNAGLIDFFRTPRLRARTLNLFYQWFMLSGVYYGLSINATSLGGNPFVTLAISGLLEVPAELLVGVLFIKIGRRWSMFIFNIFGGIACISMMFVEPKSRVKKMGVSRL